MINIQEMTGKVASETVSAEDGAYQLDGLEPKYYTVRAVATAHAPGEVGDVPAPREQVDVTLTEGIGLTGTVSEEGGAAIAGAKIEAYREIDSANVFDIIINKARPAVDSVTSDADGSFQFQTLGTGIYSFQVEAKGYQGAQELKKSVSAGQRLAFRLKPGLKLHGIVRGPNDEPLSGARVRASSTANTGTRKDQVRISFDDGSVATDDQGNFAFDTLEEGAYLLLCWHPDYATLRRQDVRPSGDEVVLKLGHGGSVRGRVTEAGGNPIAGAKLQAQDVADLHKDAVTQEDGTYLLSGLQGGNRPVRVTVSAPGFARLPRDVKVQENREVEENFELQPTGTVSGLVTNTNGDPLRGARVMAKKADNNNGVEQTLGSDITDAEGRFVLNGVESGDNLWVRVKKSEYLEGLSQRFASKAGDNVELETIVLQLGGALSGKVVGGDGNPALGCMVSVRYEDQTELDSQQNPTSTTNARGEFVIRGLRSGVVDVVAKAAHFLEATQEKVEVREGQVRSDLVITLDRGNSLGGTVTDGTGKAVLDADVVVRDYSQGGKELRTRTTDGGAFHVEGIVANDVVDLEVSHGNFGGYSAEKVRVGQKNLAVVLKELGRIRGLVVNSEGAPVESFSVQPQAPEAKGKASRLKAETFSAKDGAFEYKGVPAGTYTVHVRSPQYSAANVANIQVAEGEVVDLQAVVLEVGGLVSGRVIDAATGNPLEGVRVQIVQGANRFVAPSPDTATGAATSGNPIQTTGTDGAFQFSGLKGGNLSLRFSHPEFVTLKRDDINPDIAERSKDLEIALEKGGEIVGQVVGGDGQARGGMPVYLIGGSPGRNQTQQTDSDGRFHFGSVASGSYTVKAHKFGKGNAQAEQAESPVEMSAGKSVEVVLTVE
jgi:protocatechuate 3,4-dioxygenase beta subunit